LGLFGEADDRGLYRKEGRGVEVVFHRQSSGRLSALARQAKREAAALNLGKV